MISKGKRRYLVALYTPDGFFYRGNTLCFKMGNVILVNMIATSMHQPETFSSVSTPPNIAFKPDSLLSVNKPNDSVEPFDVGKISQWCQWAETIKQTSQFGRNETMALMDPSNFEIVDTIPEAQLHWVQKYYQTWGLFKTPNGGV